jgi:hypothetical protein
MDTRTESPKTTETGRKKKGGGTSMKYLVHTIRVDRVTWKTFTDLCKEYGLPQHFVFKCLVNNGTEGFKHAMESAENLPFDGESPELEL